MGNFSNLKEIVSNPTHQVACLGFVKVAKAQSLKVVKNVATHIVFYVDAQEMAPFYPNKTQAGLYHINAEHQNKANNHLGPQALRDPGL